MRWLLLACLAASPVAAQDLDRGARLFAQNCAVCHGADGRGGGPMEQVLVVPPPDLTRITDRYGGFPRTGLAWIIDGRDPILSHGGDMPIYGYVFGDMSVVMRSPGGQTVLTAPEVVDLVDWLEAAQE
jgi:mono/diheme cytochrome c family protein